MATKVIKSFKELENQGLNICKQLCEFAANEVYEAINYFLNQYYTEWTPKVYQRTYELLHSAFKTDIKRVGNGYEIVVGIDYESLDNYENATGYQVVTWANTKGVHGGLDVSDKGANTAVWNDTMDVTINSGQLIKDCAEFLKSKGFKIVNV